jgi:hypothetical protein
MRPRIQKKATWFGLTAAAGLTLALTAAGLAGAGVRSEAGMPTVAYRLLAQLTPSQVVPAPTAVVPASATGQFTGVLIRTRVSEGKRGGGVFAWRLVWRLTYSGLSSPATSAQIHIGAQGASGPQLAALCGPCALATRGSMEVTAAQAAALLQGNAYALVATVNNPGGEIRGQIQKIRLPLTPPPPVRTKPGPVQVPPGPSRDGK